MDSAVINIAEAFDRGAAAEALALLRSVDFSKTVPAGRIVVLGLWRRAIAANRQELGLSSDDVRQMERLFDQLARAQKSGDVWPLLERFDVAEALVGAELLSRIVRSVLWDVVKTAPFGFQYQFLTRVFLGDTGLAYQAAFAHLLVSDKTFVPDYWQSQSLVRAWSEIGEPDPLAAAAALLKRTERTDLDVLFRVYVLFATQTNAEEGYALARTIVGPTQKERLAGYLLGASQTEDDMTRAVTLHQHLSDDTEHQQFMQARLAVVEARWDDVRQLTDTLIHHKELKNEAVCLRALALSHLGDFDNARAALQHVRSNHGAKWFLRARANLINVSRRLLEDGQDLPNDVAAPSLSVLSGRPLAMSLWIGPRLRWIEEMSIRSYLLNGWRYQLYTYEAPESVPEGVEVMDASAILPRSEIFAEGSSSGMHKGSVGAFSDLFRYALLSKRGGMWTDTDVINLRRFDPEGARFISTERSDGGLIGLNGALMAAPAHDDLQTNALRRSFELIAEGGLHFARIGPELLAEMIADGGTQGYDLLPTDFMNPIGWMETGKLLQPYDKVAGIIQKKAPANIHVYTETWRLLGLSLDRPPVGGSYLSTLYHRIMESRIGSAENGRLAWHTE